MNNILNFHVFCANLCTPFLERREGAIYSECFFVKRSSLRIGEFRDVTDAIFLVLLDLLFGHSVDFGERRIDLGSVVNLSDCVFEGKLALAEGLDKIRTLFFADCFAELLDVLFAEGISGSPFSSLLVRKMSAFWPLVLVSAVASTSWSAVLSAVLSPSPFPLRQPSKIIIWNNNLNSIQCKIEKRQN